MWVGLALVILVFIAAICARLLGAMRGAVVLTLLLIIAGMVTYKFVDSGGAYLMVMSFALPIIMAAIGLGTAAGKAMKSKRYYAGLILLMIPMALWGWSMAMKFIEEQTEHKEIQFVRTHPEVIAKIGNSGEIYPASKTIRGGSSLPSRYEYSFKDRYILVDVTYDFWTPTLSLACITDISMGMRPAFGDICKQK